MSDPLPPTERLYLLDTYHVSLPKGARVLAVLEEPDAKAPEQKPRTAVVLDRTIFHPQGGGQPADQGRITLLLRRRGREGDGKGDADGEGDGGASVEFAVESVRDDGAGVLKHYGAYVGDVVAGAGFEAGDEVALQVRDHMMCLILGAGRFHCVCESTSIDRFNQRTQVDEARRRLNARLHSAGHALDVAMALIGMGGECLKPTKGACECVALLRRFLGG